MTVAKRQSGLTLTELLVVVAVMALLLGISVPTAQHLMDSFESSTGTRHLINAALANARAIAVRNQAYAGVRFQENADGVTCMVFIIHDKDATGDAQGFRAVPGRKPMKLPEDAGLVSVAANSNDALWGQANWTNATTFSIVFSPSGKLTTHEVQCVSTSASDTIFNTDAAVQAGTALFRQDEEADKELSVHGFRMYDKQQVKTNTDTLWDEVFSKIEPDYVSPYTGELVMEYNDDTL